MRVFLLVPLTLSLLAAGTAPLDVPFVRQTGSGCGSAAVAMVMEYWAQRVPGLTQAQLNAKKINTLLPPESLKGIRGSELKQYFAQNGFDAYVVNGEMEDIRHHLDKGRPLIVCFAPAHSVFFLHYAVVTGVDDSSIWLNDPERGKLIREDLPRFIKEWRKTGNWALLAVPHERRFPPAK